MPGIMGAVCWHFAYVRIGWNGAGYLKLERGVSGLLEPNLLAPDWRPHSPPPPPILLTGPPLFYHPFTHQDSTNIADIKKKRNKSRLLHTMFLPVFFFFLIYNKKTHTWRCQDIRSHKNISIGIRIRQWTVQMKKRRDSKKMLMKKRRRRRKTP